MQLLCQPYYIAFKAQTLPADEKSSHAHTPDALARYQSASTLVQSREKSNPK
jgi:hypothetical protein